MRCFLAIDIDPEIKNMIGKVQKELDKEGIKLVQPNNIHITLQFLGEVADTDSVIQQLKKIKWSPFKVEFKGVGAFPNNNYIRVLWVGAHSSQLNDLAKTLIGNEKFTGHATIARVKKKISGLEKFLENNKNLYFGSQQVNSFSLKKSDLTPQGAIYQDVCVFNAGK